MERLFWKQGRREQEQGIQPWVKGECPHGKRCARLPAALCKRGGWRGSQGGPAGSR